MFANKSNHAKFHTRLALLALACALMMLTATAPAQQPAPTDPPPPTAPVQEEPAKSESEALAFDDLPPAVKLGVRTEMVRRSLRVHAAVVIVRTGDAYIEAIKHWSPEARFPVLIDDGSLRAKEDIGRFVRAFLPEIMLFWEGNTARESEEQGEDNDDSLRARVNSAVARAWGAQSYRAVGQRWMELRLPPPGVVIAAEDDPAWTAALALAAGRAQPLLWIEPIPGRLGASMSRAEFDDLDRQVRAGLEFIGANWKQLGDMVDALSLCLHTPMRVKDESDVLATTDLLGRHPDGSRYAWCGQVPGSESVAAYRAMCALFLQPERAWLFDGYVNEPPYSAFNVKQAAERLEQIGVGSDLNTLPNGGEDDWRARAARPTNAGLIHVNSSGFRRWFKLNPGRAAGSDIPMLRVPAIVHFVHSFSAQNVGDRESIAGRWLEHGAYAYYGAVDEPFLSAFHTPGAFVQRLLSAAPLGAAVRLDGQRAWKLALIGDPLITVGAQNVVRGPPTRRIAEAPELDGAKSIDALMSESLRDGQYAEGVRFLVMLGRDADATRLVRAVRRDQPNLWNSEIADAALPALFRTGQRNLFFNAYVTASEGVASDPLYRDLLWLAMRGELSTTRSPLLVETLRRRMRDETLGVDGALLAHATKRVSGVAAAESLLQDLMSRTENARQLKLLRKALSSL